MVAQVNRSLIQWFNCINFDPFRGVQQIVLSEGWPV